MFGHHALDCRLDALLCGDIAVDRIRLAAGICDLGHNLRTTFHVDVGDRDQRAIRRHPDRARAADARRRARDRSEEHTSELQSLMRISYAVFCLKKKKTTK